MSKAQYRQHVFFHLLICGHSEQQLVDCATDDFGFTLECDGGLTDWAWDSIQAKGGFVPEKSYPYLGVVCSYSFVNF